MVSIKMGNVKRFYDTFTMGIIGFIGDTLQIYDGHLKSYFKELYYKFS